MSAKLIVAGGNEPSLNRRRLALEFCKGATDSALQLGITGGGLVAAMNDSDAMQRTAGVLLATLKGLILAAKSSDTVMLAKCVVEASKIVAALEEKAH